jgi:hypothetical protein
VAAERLRLAWLLLVVLLLVGCKRPTLPRIMGPINEALDIVCETRASLRAVQACGEDVGCKIDVLKDDLVRHGYDDEVAALLQLLEAQERKLKQEWGF